MGTHYLTNNNPASQVVPESLNSEQATEIIIERAKKLVSQLIADRGHDKPPFLPEEFANLLGIMRVEKVDLGRTSGILIRIPGDPIIKVNQSHNKARQNFSCAHEIGHNLLRELKIELDTENIKYRTFDPQARVRTLSKTRERLCEAAAAELLMPEFVFRKYLLAFGVSVHSIERLANIFRVSVRATAIRIAEVSIEPCIALLWKPWVRTRSTLLHLAWCIGPSVKSRGKTYYVPVHTNVRYPSKLHEAYQDKSSVKSFKLFRVDTTTKRLPMESKGFGRGENRYVVSLAFLDR